MGRRPPCCDKSNVKNESWTAEEDAQILAYGLNRCGTSCRLRWTNYLRPDLKHDSFTPQEEELILSYHQAIGSRWSLIAKKLPGRTDNDVKNHWNTKLKKRLTKMGIDPITHKPLSQLLLDYGNSSCDKSHVKKGSWTVEEDAKILAYVASHGIGNWSLVPKKAGLNRCGKSCRLRWTNYLRPDLKHDSFTPQEEELILSYHQAIGSRQVVINSKKTAGKNRQGTLRIIGTRNSRKISNTDTWRPGQEHQQTTAGQPTQIKKTPARYLD